MTPTLLTHRTKPTPGGPAGLYFTANKKQSSSAGSTILPKKQTASTQTHHSQAKITKRETERDKRLSGERQSVCINAYREEDKEEKKEEIHAPLASLQPRPLPRPHLLLEAAVHGLSGAERVSGQLPPPAERRADHGSAVRHVEHPVLLQHLSQDKSTAAIKSLSSSRSTEPARARPTRS